MCPVKDRDCKPVWVPDEEVFAAWKDAAVSGVITMDDSPPF